MQNAKKIVFCIVLLFYSDIEISAYVGVYVHIHIGLYIYPASTLLRYGYLCTVYNVFGPIYCMYIHTWTYQKGSIQSDIL